MGTGLQGSSPPLVVIVTGLPGAGKTTLGRRLAVDVGLTCFSKDDFKEIPFDCLGGSERHPGHVDHPNYRAVQALIERDLSQLVDLGGVAMDVDTTDPSSEAFD